MFKIGSYVVYKRDVCRVNEIKTNNDKEYYVLVPVNDESLTIDLPVSNDNFLRNIIDSDSVNKIIKEIPNISEIENVDDKLLEQEYKKLINDGSHESLIKIIKTTYMRNKNRIDSKRKIGEKDDAYFKKAEKYLYTEFSIALNLSYEETKEYVENLVKQTIEKKD